MMKNLKRIKKLEKKVENIIEDPAKIIGIISRIIKMGTCDLDGNWNIKPPVPEEMKVTFYEFVKYFGNHTVERSEEHGWDVEETIKKMALIEIEERIREIGGFSDNSLPDGIEIKYR